MMCPVVFQLLSQLNLWHILIGEHVKLNHHQCYSALSFLFATYLVMSIFKLVMERYNIRKHIKRLTKRVTAVIHNKFDQHYKCVMSNRSRRKRTTKYRHKTSTRSYYHNGGRIRKRSRRYVPYLLIAATYCRAMPMYSESNEVEHLHQQTHQNDDHTFNIDELWSEHEPVDEDNDDYVSEEEALLHEDLKYQIHVVHHVTDDNALDEGDDFLAYSSYRRRFSPEKIQMDTDSYPIGIDSYASRCISPHRSDFVKGTLLDLRKPDSVRPFGKGQGLDIKQMGTLKWKFEDDLGVTHRFLIKNALYVPEGSMRLLSPQHFAKNANEPQLSKLWDKEDFTSTQHWNRNVLRWGSDMEFRKTVYNSRRSNVPTFFSSPTLTDFTAFCSTTDEDIEHETVHAVSPTVPLHSQSSAPFMSEEIPPTMTKKVSFDLSQQEFCGFTNPNKAPLQEENMQDFTKLLQGETAENNAVTSADEEIIATSRKAEFTRWHYRLGHMDYAKMRRIAKLGYLP